MVQGCTPTLYWATAQLSADVTDVYQETVQVDLGTALATHTLFDGQPEPLMLVPQTFLVNQIGDGTPDNLADAAQKIVKAVKG